MAKILVEIDTVEMTLNVVLNGETITDVSSVNVYKCEDYNDQDHIMVDIIKTEDKETTGDPHVQKRTYYSVQAAEKFVEGIPEKKTAKASQKYTTEELAKALCPWRTK